MDERSNSDVDGERANRKRRAAFEETAAVSTPSSSPPSDSKSMKTEADEIERLRQQNCELKQLLLRSIRKDPRVWEDLPEEWKEESEFVVAGITGQLLLWRDLPTRWKEDCHVTEAAYRTNWRQRAHDRVHWIDLPEKCLSNGTVIVTALLSDYGGIKWNDVPTHIKQNEGRVAVYGVSNLLIDADSCPCLLNRAFVKDALMDGSLSWRHLPTELKTDMEFARGLETLPNVYNAGEIFQQFPPLRQDRAMWVKVLNADEVQGQGLCKIIWDFAPAAILSDRELMLTACSIDGRAGRLIDPIFLTDREFVDAATKRNTASTFASIVGMPRAVQRRFPDIVHIGLQQTKENLGADASMRDFNYLADCLPREFWDDRDFVLRWFGCGLPYISRGLLLLPESRADKEFFIRIAKNCLAAFRPSSFEQASLELRSDKKFMLRVLEADPSLCGLIAASLRNDPDLCLVTFSSEISVLRDEMSRRHYDFVEDFRSELSTRLNAHRIFTTVVLPAMTQTVGPRSALSELNQGIETSLKYKKNIAQCLHVPIGKELRMVRKAFRNLNHVLGNTNNAG